MPADTQALLSLPTDCNGPDRWTMQAIRLSDTYSRAGRQHQVATTTSIEDKDRAAH